MKRVSSETCDLWKEEQLEKLLKRVHYGEETWSQCVWYGSGRFFSLFFDFPELNDQEAAEFQKQLNRLVNYDGQRVRSEQFRGLFEVSTQPMSLMYHRNMMPWGNMLEWMSKWFDEDINFIVKVDRRSLSEDAEEKVSKLVQGHWDEFMAACARFSLEANICAVAMIGRNLEFRLFQRPRGREQLLTILKFVDCLCTESTWNTIIQRMEEFYVQ